MGQVPAVLARDVSKVYRRFLHKNQFKTLKSALVSGSLLKDLRPEETFTALSSVSFEVPKGTTFGVIGENGSGKSTLLKLLAGITRPTRGTLSVEGRISALIELGAGFHPEISGRENVAINGIMLGLSRREVDERFQEIVAFAELERFIDAPVKTYSSGMYARLGFAVAIHVDPDVLLIDEVLAVGDEAFTRKCLDKIGEFRRKGKTIVIVTHSLGLVEKMCDDVLWLRGGRIADQGDPKRVVDAYLTYVAGGEEALLAREEPHLDGGTPPAGPPGQDLVRHGYREGRWGSREVEIEGIRLLDDRGKERHVYVPGESLKVELKVRAKKPQDDFVFGFGLFTADGINVYGTNTHLEEFKPARLGAESVVSLVLEDLRLVEGTYLLDVAVHRRDGTPYDYHRGLRSFRIKSHTKDVGVYRPHHRWLFEGDISLVRAPMRSELDLHTDAPGRIASRDELARERGAWRDLGLKVVFTNGCFDILHPGHLALLEKAKAAGDILVVGINSDASVRGLKGEARPVNPESERAETLLALEAVDRVVIYEEPTPLETISAIAPDVLVKGADWALENIVGRDVVEAAGGTVLRVDLLPGNSTTAILERIRRP